MNKLICITGMDGTGKSTLVQKLSESFNSVHVANIWDIMDGDMKIVLFRSKKDIDGYLCSLTPDSRLLFLAHAIRFSMDKALRSGKEVILINAYYYKYFATELALGASESLVKALMNEFPYPDQVIALQLPIEIAAERKPYYSRYECGIADVPEKKAFIEFQKKVEERWSVFERTNWKYLDAQASREEMITRAIQFIS